MFNPNDLRIFCKVAEIGNMSRVAESEAKTVMAISKQIGRLESSLNRALFIRTRRHLELTDFGQAFKYKVELLLEQYQDLMGWTQNQEDRVTGELRVVCQSNEVIKDTLVPWLADFTSMYPDLNIVMDVREGIIDILQDDFDIFWAVGDYLGQRFPGLKRKSLWAFENGLFASHDYLTKMGMPLSPDDLEKHTVIGYLHNQPSNVLITRGEDGNPHYVMPNCQIKTVAGLLELAESGLGVINAPANTSTMQDLIRQNRLEPILENYWWKEAEVYVYYHPSRPTQAKIRAFLDFFVDKREQWKL
ncbi:LysR family transcriptional regulator [Glaciecola sp. 1036]|uniref:LysR family transcriptional regulator n=1 Tax=Alteromonadaceae TaxID=72275 RepID=UPI003D00C417